VTARRLFYLNTHRLTAYRWQGGRLHAEASFANGEEGLAAFQDYLGIHRRSEFTLLANIAEEGHVLETIPFLQGADRQALITRKIGQHFMGTPLAAAFSLGYEKTRRKNEKLLLSALTNPAHFEPWLQRIGEAEAPLAGIYTVAQLGGGLLQKLGNKDKRCILLSMQDHSIRESYLVDGQTLFSRMAPISDSSIAGIASSFAAEASKLQQYLIGQRLISRDESLPVFIFAHPTAIPAIEKACPDHGKLNFAIIDSHQAAANLGLKTPPEDNRCDLLFLHQLATNPPRQQFASPAHRHDYRIAQLRRGIVACGLIILLGGLLFAARESYVAWSLANETRQLLASQQEFDARYGEVSDRFPQLGIDKETLRRLTDRYAELSRQQRLPEHTLLRLSRALDQVPAVTLSSLEWQIGRNPADQQDSEEITIVRGSIDPDTTASIRQVLALFETFTDLLRIDPDNRVRILQPPYDMESERPLRGGDEAASNRQPRAFAIEITRTVTP
jgi:hypothetical protein